MSATDAPVQNWMGRIGASIAAPLFMIVGWGAWGHGHRAAVSGARVSRCIAGDERAVGRLIFAPIWIALWRYLCCNLDAGRGVAATHSFRSGRAVRRHRHGRVLTILPLGASLAVKRSVAGCGRSACWVWCLRAGLYLARTDAHRAVPAGRRHHGLCLGHGAGGAGCIGCAERRAAGPDEGRRSARAALGRSR